MDVVLGSSPLAVSLARHLAAAGEDGAALAGPVAREGTFLWRRCQLDTGEGVRAVVRGARRVWLVLDEEAGEAHGAFAVLRNESSLKGAVVVGIGRPFPPGAESLASWARVEVGPCWGPDEPLHRAWTEALKAGRRVWMADPGTIPFVQAERLLAALAQAPEVAEGRWSLVTHKGVHLPELLERLAKEVGQPARTLSVPLGWAARRAGVDAARVRRWLSCPEGRWTAPGLESPA